MQLMLGLGLFLFGVRFLATYIRSVFTKSFRARIQRWVQKEILGFFIGAGLITITQSVTALIMVIIGMVKTNVIPKNKALALILGANIGSYFMIFLLSIDLITAVTVALGISGIIYGLSKSRSFEVASGTLFGIGCLFYGLYNIQLGATPLAQDMTQAGALIAFAKEYYAATFLLGVVLALISHSSIFVVVLAISLAKSGLFELEHLVMITYGSSVGTGILLQLEMRRAEGEVRQLVHYQHLHKFFGLVILIPLFFIEVLFHVPLLIHLSTLISDNIGMQATFVYFVLNATPLLFMIPLHGQIKAFLEKNSAKSIEDIYSKPQFLTDTNLLEPSIVLDCIELEQIRIMRTLTMYMDEMRRSGNLQNIHELAKSTNTLSKAIREEIGTLVQKKKLNIEDYTRLNDLLVIQHIIEQCYTSLMNLSESLYKLKKNHKYNHLYRAAIESVDVITMMVYDHIQEPTQENFDLLEQVIVSKNGGVNKMRELYLNDSSLENIDARAGVLPVINTCEIIYFLLLDFSKKYAKYAKSI